MYTDRKQMYKVPWSTTDNQGGWIEVTDRCNLKCPGCYRKSIENDKPLEIIKKEIVDCQKTTNCDVMVIAGGEPLIYPQIVEVVRFIAQLGMKPLILSNGINFTRKLGYELKTAGLKRIHFHVDSRQNRENWEDKNEKELNELRDYYADLISGFKGVQCGFHIMISNENLKQIPEIINWYRSNMHRIHHISLIALRGLTKPENYEYLAGNEVIPPGLLENFYLPPNEVEVSTNDMFEIIHRDFPDYLPASYINGSSIPDSNKYLFFVNIGARNMFYGCLGSKSMELSQVFHRIFKGRYLSFNLKPAIGKKIFLLSVLDKHVGKAFIKYLKACLKDPRYLFRKVYIQSLILQQPVEFIDGERNSCEPCINPMMFQDQVINPCQLDEYRVFGGVLTSIKV